MKKTIVVISMFTYTEYIKGISNTNSHVFGWLKQKNPNANIIFADFNRIGFINRLKYLIKFVLLNNPVQKVFYTFTNQLEKIDNNIFAYHGLDYGLLFNYLAQENTEVEVWCFNPFFNPKKIKSQFKYFYTIDDWRKNKVFIKFSDKLKQRYRQIPDEYNKVFINNESLKDKLYPQASNIHFIPNGVDTRHFENYENTAPAIKKKIDHLIDTDKPIVGYMGVISPDRVDYDLCHHLVRTHSNYQFIFAGPVLPGFDADSLQTQYKNINFIGTVFFDEFPYLYHRFDVCIIPHLVNEFIQSMDPKKMYEYMAAGKPIVTTPVSGTDKFSEYIQIAKNKEDFASAITFALEQDNQQLISQRIKIARQHDWSVRFAQIDRIISA